MADYGFRRKLIEVALPLDAINAASAREKSIRHGHPSTLHLWWARRPLAACRAVLFASLVDDPSARPDLFPTEEAQGAERERLFGLVERLVQWENSGDAGVLGEARAEIAKCCDGGLPSVLDPFAGGGSIPLEAQRLGLEAHGSDLNPVAVLINKALVEIPPVFAGRAPVNPGDRQSAGLGSWPGASGLACDVRWYGSWMRQRAGERIGHLYPEVELPAEHGGGKAPVIAWLWTRTARCPNPVCGAEAPLASSWWLSKKKGRQAWIEPVADHAAKTVRYEIGGGEGGPSEAPKQGRAQFRYVFCSSAMPTDHVRAQAQGDGLGARLMAVVAQGDSRRVYLPSDPFHEQAACIPPPPDPPAGRLPDEALGFRVQRYGMGEWADLFTPRQLTVLCCFADLVGEAREQARADALAAGMGDDPTPLRDGGTGAAAYTEAVSVYLGFAVSKLADRGSQMCTWDITRGLRSTFARQAIPMNWDFVEANPFSDSTGNWSAMVDFVQKALAAVPAKGRGVVVQRDASALVGGPVVVSTDPPYYDNIGYADLSDFFYVWLRRTVGRVFPDVCSTLLAPKAQELIAAPYRHGGDRGGRGVLRGWAGRCVRPSAAGAGSGVPVERVLRVQAVRNRGGGDGVDGVGDHAHRAAARGLPDNRDVAGALGAGQPDALAAVQRAGVVDCSGVPAPARGRAVGVAPRVLGRAGRGAARRAGRSPGGQHRAGGCGASRDRAGHGGVLPLQPGDRGRRRPNGGAGRFGRHQPGAR